MTSILKVSTIQNTAGTAPTAADLGLNVTGSVLQVQHFDYTGSEFNTSSTSDVATPIAVSITPKYSNSKILVMCETNLRKNASVDAAGASCHLYRDTTKIRNTWQNVYGLTPGGNIGLFGHWSGHYYDTPNTTSQITYTLYVNSYNGYSVVVGDGGSGGQMTVMEIAG